MPLKVAVIQMRSGCDRSANLKSAARLVKRAVDNKARFILLPEVFNYRGKITTARDLKGVAEPIPGPSTDELFKIAGESNVYILAGSVLERSGGEKAYNTSVLISPQGKQIAKYRKKNLFTANIGRQPHNEAKFLKPGRSAAMARVDGFNVGLTICYDLRFSSLYNINIKRGAHILCVPSSFTRKTGAAHWEVLLRARAIEGCCYVLAPNQAGVDGRGVATYGNSMIVDPWGRVIKRASGTKEEICYAVLDKKEIRGVRKILPRPKI